MTDLSVPNQSSISELEAKIESARTPLESVEMREGRSDQVFFYTPVQQVIEMLNDICNFDWSFNIDGDRVMEDNVTVLGRLTIRGGGKELEKMQYGSSQIKRRQSDGSALSIGDDFKAAASDALKKCAQQVGIGSDLSTEIRPQTMKAFHATGNGKYGDEWDEKRPVLIKVATGNKKSSTKELLDIEARILIALMKGEKGIPIVDEIRQRF